MVDAALQAKVAAYRPDEVKIDSIRRAPMILMVGITAAGKNAIIHRLMEQYPDQYYFLVSHTSRPPRINHSELERDGVHYHFVDLPKISSMLDNRDFIEAAVIHDSWISGSSVDEVQKSQSRGVIAISDIDIQGAEIYTRLGLNVKPVFILPPSFEVWKQRFVSRNEGKFDASELSARMQSAIREIEHALMLENFYIVINDDLDKTVAVVHDIAQGQPVEPHYQKAMTIAEQLLASFRAELAKLV